MEWRREVAGRAVWWEQRGCYPRGGEAQEIEADEEELIQGAGYEEDGLGVLLVSW